MNTAFLTLIINGNIWHLMGDNAEVSGDHSALENLNSFGVMNGQFVDFGEQWYEEVSVPIVVTMLINMVTAPLFVLVDAARTAYMRCSDRSCSSDKTLTKQVTQHGLEVLYTGPEFLLYLKCVRACS